MGEITARMKQLASGLGRGLLGAAAAAALLLPAAHPAAAEESLLRFPLARVSTQLRPFRPTAYFAC